MKFLRPCSSGLLLAALCLTAAAQDRDFLTTNEVEQVREAQEPNQRLLLYIHFAKQRLDLVNQYLAKEKPGRSIFIHDALEDYRRIIEAIDAVSDNALRQNVSLDKGMLAVINAEKGFLDQLNKIADAPPKDYARYKFVLTEAINTTGDSHDLSLEDANKRKINLNAEDTREKTARESVMSSEELKDRKKAAEKEDKPKKQAPSLLKPGEKPPQ